MIRLDLSLATGLYCVVILLAIAVVCFLSWVWKHRGEENAALVRCPYCGHTFFDYLGKNIIVCPLCKSYLESRHEKKEKQ